MLGSSSNVIIGHPYRSRPKAVERITDQPPRGESVFAPRVGRDDAVIGTAAHAIGDPLTERVVVGWCPTAVHLEPPDRALDGFVGGVDHRGQYAHYAGGNEVIARSRSRV